MMFSHLTCGGGGGRRGGGSGLSIHNDVNISQNSLGMLGRDSILNDANCRKNLKVPLGCLETVHTP
jgi:hypothetical protein